MVNWCVTTMPAVPGAGAAVTVTEWPATGLPAESVTLPMIRATAFWPCAVNAAKKRIKMVKHLFMFQRYGGCMSDADKWYI